jgi:hypothetical protein
MDINPPQFPKFDKAAVEAEIKQKSADYIASQPKERNEGWMHSGVNQFTRSSYNITPAPDTAGTRFVYTGPKDPGKA